MLVEFRDTAGWDTEADPYRPPDDRAEVRSWEDIAEESELDFLEFPVIEVAQFLGEAMAAGIIGNALYDGIRNSVRRIRVRWAARRRKDADERLLEQEALELAKLAVSVQLGRFAEGGLSTLSAVIRDDGWWYVDVVAGGADPREVYRVLLPPGDPENARVIVYRRPREHA